MLQSIGTVLAFLAFIAICVWAYSPSRKKQFDDAAKLPFEDDFPAKQDQSTEKKIGNGDEGI